MPMLEDTDLSQDEKREVIHALWQMMDALTDRAFGLHPAQQVKMSTLREFAGRESDLIDSKSLLSPRNDKAADKPDGAL